MQLGHDRHNLAGARSQKSVTWSATPACSNCPATSSLALRNEISGLLHIIQQYGDFVLGERGEAIGRQVPLHITDHCPVSMRADHCPVKAKGAGMAGGPCLQGINCNVEAPRAELPCAAPPRVLGHPGAPVLPQQLHRARMHSVKALAGVPPAPPHRLSSQGRYPEPESKQGALEQSVQRCYWKFCACCPAP